MHFSILHISDLHRDLSDEINNVWLLESLISDFGQFDRQTPEIIKPTLAVVTGDLVYGVAPGMMGAGKELERQYAQAEEFLVGLAEQFFEGRRERVVILPGNHDICYRDVMACAQSITIPLDQAKKAALVTEFFMPRSMLRWSWRDLCFYRIFDTNLYLDRLRYFAAAYERFYQGSRTFPREPELQYDTFDFPDIDFSIVALNSCFNNDPLRRAGAFHPSALTEACRTLRQPSRAGWLLAVAWHHNLVGGPAQDDFLDPQFLQLLMDAGASIGFHGHQHLAECFDERYRIGPDARKITIVSASTLCAEPSKLSPGAPRSYNVVEVDTAAWTGRVHQRQMVNKLYNLPVWGPGHFVSTNRSYCDFELCRPLAVRPSKLDAQLLLEEADRAIGTERWQDAISILDKVRDAPLARPLLLRALAELGEARTTIATLWPPQSIEEAVMVGGAIVDSGTREEANSFLHLELVMNRNDASLREISHRVRERRLK
ncbi:MAG TPA: metallophosphoesterase [Candidatus Binataceae bacterium]|nr:metallophosphoesterase [Candidatus Binataceae bacterium]